MKGCSFLPHATNRLHVQNYVAESILLLVREGIKKVCAFEQQGTTAIIKYVKKGLKVDNSFVKKCKEIFDYKKKRNGVYFRELGHTDLFVPRNRAGNDYDEDKRTNEMEKAYQKTL